MPIAVSTPDPYESYCGIPEPRGTRTGKISDATILILVFPALLFALFASAIGKGRILGWPDSDEACEWWWKRQYVGEVMHSWHLPQWNPYAMSGAPLLATSQPAPFYPGNWPYAFLRAHWVMNANILFHWWLGLAGMYLLLRWPLRRGIAAGLLGAVVFGLGGVSIQHWRSGHLQFNAEIAMIPWAAIPLLRLFQARDARGLATAGLWLALVLSLQFLAGHPQIVYYTTLVLALLVVGWMAAALRRSAWMRALFTPATLLVPGALVAGMVAAQYLPLREFAKLTVRTQNEPLNYFTTHSQQISNLFTMVSPWAFGGRPKAPTFYMDTNLYWETTAFTGVIALLMITGAFVRLHRTPAIIWVCLIGAIVCEWLALGKYGPAFEFAFRHVPGFNLFRCPGRLLIPFTFFISVLTGIGLDELLRSAARSYKIVLAWWVMAFALVGGLSLWYWISFRAGIESTAFRHLLEARLAWLKDRPFSPSIMRDRFAEFHSGNIHALKIAIAVLLVAPLLAVRRLRQVVALLIAAGGIAEVTAAANVWRNSFSREQISWPVEVVQNLKAAGPMYRMTSNRDNLDLCQGMIHGVRNVWGYETGTVQRYSEAMAGSQVVALSIAFMSNDNLGKLTPFLSTLGVRHLVTSHLGGMPPSSWKPVLKRRDIELFENPDALPRIRLADHAVRVSEATALQTLYDPAFRPSTTVLVESLTTNSLMRERLTSSTLETTGPAPGEVVVLQDDAELQRVRVKMQRAGWLVVMDQLLPGWSATLDHEPVSIYRANAVGRAIPVPQGEHEVEFQYRAPGLRTGLLTSAFAWAFCFLAMAGLFLTRRSSVPHRLPPSEIEPSVN